MADYTIGNSNLNCGCTCVNDSIYADCGDPIPQECDNVCPDAPCSYAIMFMCSRPFGGNIDYHPITTVWRDCLWDSSSYTARSASNASCVGQYDDQGNPVLDANGNPVQTCIWLLSEEAGAPCQTPCDVRLKDCTKGYVQYFPPVWYNDPYPRDFEWKPLDFTCCQVMPAFGELFRDETICLDTGPYDFGCISSYMPCPQRNGDCPCYSDETPMCVRCGWGDFHNIAFAGPTVLNDTGVMATLVESWPVVWQLVNNGGTALIYGFAYEWESTRDPKYRIVYECSSFDCHGRSEFVRTDWNGWVEEDDITPDNNNDHPAIWLPRTVCVTPYSTAFKTPCDTTADACNCKDVGWTNGIIEVQGECANWSGVSNTIIVYRNYDDSLIPSCITVPSGPCGYFFGFDYVRNMAYVLWCDGGLPWNLDVWCTEDNWTTCTKVCDADVQNGDGDFCQAYSFTWACDDFGACCTVPCTSCDPAGKTLNYDITGLATGSGTFAGSGLMCFSETLSNGDRMSLEISMVDCTARIGCNGTDCGTFNCIASLTPTLNSCEPFDMSIAINIGFLCSACQRGTYTVHIYE